ncbi:hypothetical protein AF72_01225 [Xylella taiwanensis]|uniref:Uncharacterized protein n=1 Tax=Xylella taiwanensis TaxID=1444770 RepID=Z9JM37_9GAMM|nr:hypothetical protein AB672_05110 [Xylella taiwanensis]EWS79234.1 hypothetical protein AF72_01225 [Xylella taiwanensis]
MTPRHCPHNDQGRLTRSQTTVNQSEGDEHDIELLAFGTDTAIALEPVEQGLELITTLVHLVVISPRLDVRVQQRHDKHETRVKRPAAHLVAL